MSEYIDRYSSSFSYSIEKNQVLLIHIHVIGKCENFLSKRQRIQTISIE